MSIPSQSVFRRSLAVLTLTASMLLGLTSRSHAVADNALTQHIWKLKYGVSDAQMSDSNWLNQDSDGDGIKNKDEIAAGTNPFSAGSVVKIASISLSAGNVSITFPTENGKNYVVQGVATMTATFGTLSPAVSWNGTGAAKTLTFPKGANNFFRILVQDIDTDGDGVADWAENAVSLNPLVAQTVSGTDDYSYVRSQVFSDLTTLAPRPNMVTIRATNVFASEDGPQAGGMTIERTMNLFPITVNYSYGSSTAVAGTDYTASPAGTAVVFAARGPLTQDIAVNPIAQGSVKGSRSVTATLSSPGAQPYSLGSQSTATVIISPSTVATGTGLLARYYDTSSATYVDAANFGQVGMYTFVRGTPTTTGTIVVTYSGPTISGLVAKAGPVPGSQVKVSFTSGNLNNALYNNFSYEVTALTANSFTLSITNASSFGGTTIANGNCNFNIQSLTHPATVTRVDPTVNFDWQFGTPNGNTIAPNNSADNYSSTWEGYLNPTVAGNYVFQLDADDKARVLLDTGSGLTQIVEHNWTTPGSDPVGTFKQSASIPLVVPASPAQRYKIRVEHVETTGDARCRLQWLVPGTTSFQNIAQGNQFTHTQALTNYIYVGGGSPKAIITPAGGHTFNVSDSVSLAFSSGVLFTPGAASTYNGTYTVTAVGGNSAPFTLPGSSTSAGSATVNVTSTAGIAVGMAVSGTGIPGNEYVTAVGPGNQITITTGTGVTLQASTTLTFTSNFTVTITPFPISVAGATTTAGSPNIVVPSTMGLATGMAVSGTGLPANEFITAIIPSANGPGLISVTTGTGVTAQASTTLTAALPAGPVTGNGFVLNVPTPPNTPSPQTGLYNLIYPNTTFTGSPGRVGIDGAVTAQNSGIWNSGTPDANLIQPDSFSVRWTGQVQPQFSENYTFTVVADDGCSLWINGQLQTLKVYPSANTGVGSYVYDATNGNVLVTYPTAVVPAGSFIVGETVRIDPSSGSLNHAPTASPTYDYDPTTGNVVVDYSSLVVGAPSGGGTRVAGSYAVGDVVELDPVSGGLSPLSTLPYVITAVDAPNNKFTFNAGPLSFTPTLNIASIATGAAAQITTTVNHNLATGTKVRITGVIGGTFAPAINDIFTITSTGANTFTVASNCTLAPTAGTGQINASGNITISDNRNAVITSVHATGTGTYSYTSGSGDVVVDFSSLGLPAGTFVNGQKIVLDPTTGNISALNSAFYTIGSVTATTFTINVGTGFTTGTGSMFIVAPANGAIPVGSTTAFTVNLATNGVGTGNGKYADNSTGSINVDLVNKSFKEWSSNGTERYVRIPMLGGVRYDIQLDHYEQTGASRCILSWFSPSQPKQIIPAERLYPTPAPVVAPLAQLAPTAHITPTDATALVNGSFSYSVAGSNGGAVSVSGNPAWLAYTPGVGGAPGTLSGNPPVGAAGDYQVIITITNSAGTSTSVLNLHVDQNGGSVVRESWSGVYANLASIPTGTAPTGTSNLTSLAGTNLGDDYGARIRGYITAPTTGNYYFWIAASNLAELWISNDDEPVNTFKRAWVNTGSATPQTWGAESNQKTPWLALEQGKKYYFEVLHKGVAGADNIAIGWLKPGETGTVPSEVVPGYALSPYVAPAAGPTTGTLYLASMLSQSGAVTNGVGSSTLRLSPDENTAYMRRSYSGLTGAITSEHIHVDPYLTKPSIIVYDIDTPVTPGDGMVTSPADPNYTGTDPQTATYKWTILPVGVYSKADIIEVIKQGKAYINLHTAAYPNGEIRGNYTLANGTKTFTPPPAPPAWTDDSNTNDGAARFLAQASFGANIADITAFKALAATSPSPAMTGVPSSRYNTWIDNQFGVSPTAHLPETLAREIADVFGPFDVKIAFNTWWKTSMTAPDQLRQRVAYALSQIHVVSGQGPLEDNSQALSYFYDKLATNAFGNFRTVLNDTTLTPSMGRYLDMLGNDKPDLAIGRSPNENYAREIKQLFSIGLYRMWPDGTLMLTSDDSPISTYTQREIVGLAHVFTGWYFGYDGDYRTSFNAAGNWQRQMRENPARHFTGQKRVLNNEVFPGLTSVGGQPLDPYATHLSTQFNDPVYQALPAQELAAAHDMLFNHPNTGPFICRQLIQRMVTSNPSRDYLYRVVQKFNDNGFGVRGDMRAVIKAILLDYEARSTDLLSIPAYGKQREPILRVANAARALRTVNVGGGYDQTAARINTSGVPYVLITTTAPHLLSAGNSVFLEFTDTTGDPAKPAPPTGTYTVLSDPVPTSTTYGIAAPGWLAGTYSQSGTTITVTMPGHWLPGDNANVFGGAQNLPPANEGRAYFDFTSGGLNNLAGFDQTVRPVVTSTSYDIPSGVGNTKTLPTVDGNYSGTTFTITAPDSATRSGNVMIARFSGSYSCTGRAGTITIDTNYGGAGTFGTMADHGLSAGDQVFLNFLNSRDTTPGGTPTSTENDIVYTIGGVPDLNTFTVQARDAANAAMNSDNQVTVFPLKALPLVRSGTINARPSTYTMDNTDLDIQQTPLNSTTVFNYFLPEYKFAGTLASQGITTPEFQLTSETTVIRQANFFYNGIFNPGSITGISSFKTGTNALVLDLSRWMNGNAADLGLGAPTSTSAPWTSNQNISVLIDQLGTLLSGGQISSGAKAVIKNFVSTPIASIGLSGSACLVTTTVPHKLVTGDTVVISGVTGGTFGGTASALNNTTTARVVTVTGLTNGTSTTFTIPLSCTVVPTSLTNAHVSVIPYNQGGTPDATQRRDRLRSIIHLILTSPDFTIQR